MLTDNREDDGEKKEKDRESGRKRRSAVKIKTKQRVRRREEIYHTQSGGRASARLRTCGVAYRISFLTEHSALTQFEKRIIVQQKPQQHWFLFLSQSERPAASAQFCFVIYIIHFQFGSYFSRHHFSRCHIKKCRKRHKMRAGASS